MTMAALQTTGKSFVLTMMIAATRRSASSFMFCGLHRPKFYQTVRRASDSCIIHLNHAGASPSPTCVIERVVQHLYHEQILGGYAAAAAVQEEVDQVYHKTAALLHAASPCEIALVESATVAWTRLFYAMAEHCERMHNKKKVILVSEADYAAQVVAMTKWAQEHEGWQVIALPSVLDDNGSSTGIVDLDVLANMLQGRHTTYSGKVLDPESIALVCVTHIPTNSGIVNPLEHIGQLLVKHEANAFYLVDACQSAGQLDLNVQNIRCHGLCGTGRKYLRAPRGSGFLYVERETASILRPSHVDHECARLVSVPFDYPKRDDVHVDYEFAESAKRFEFWESSAAGKLGFGAAVKYAMDDAGGMEVISQKIAKNALLLEQRLQVMGNVALHHPGTRSGLVTFFTDLHPYTLKQQLWCPDANGNQFEVSVVPATSTPLDSARTKVPDLVRSSISYTTTEEEIDLFCDRVHGILSVKTCP